MKDDPLTIEVERCNFPRIKEMLKQDPSLIHSKDNCGWTPLIHAAGLNLDIVKYLVSKGASFKDMDNTQCNLLMHSMHKEPEFIQYFLDNGVDPYWKNEKEEDVLMIALNVNHANIPILLKNCNYSKEYLKNIYDLVFDFHYWVRQETKFKEYRIVGAEIIKNHLEAMEIMDVATQKDHKTPNKHKFL